MIALHFEPMKEFKLKLNSWINSNQISPRHVQYTCNIPIICGKYASDIEPVRARFFTAFSGFNIGACFDDIVLLNRVRAGGPSSLSLSKYIEVPKARCHSFDNVTIWTRGRDYTRTRARLEHFIGSGCKSQCCNSPRDGEGNLTELTFKEKVQKNYEQQLRAREIAICASEPTFETDLDEYQMNDTEGEEMPFVENHTLRNFDESIKEGRVRLNRMGRPIAFIDQSTNLSRTREEKFGIYQSQSNPTRLADPSVRNDVPNMTSMIADQNEYDQTYHPPVIDLEENSDDDSNIDADIQTTEVNDINNETIAQLVSMMQQQRSDTTQLRSDTERQATEMRDQLERLFNHVGGHGTPRVPAPQSRAPPPPPMGRGTAGSARLTAPFSPIRAPGPRSPPPTLPAAPGVRPPLIPGRTAGTEPPGLVSQADRDVMDLAERVDVLSATRNQVRDHEMGLASGPGSEVNSLTSGAGSSTGSSGARTRVRSLTLPPSSVPNLFAEGALRSRMGSATSTPGVGVRFEQDMIPQTDGNGSIMEDSPSRPSVTNTTIYGLLPGDEESTNGSLTSQISGDGGLDPVRQATEQFDEAAGDGQAPPVVDDTETTSNRYHDIMVNCDLLFLLGALSGGRDMLIHWDQISDYQIIVTDEKVVITIRTVDDDIDPGNIEIENLFEEPGDDFSEEIIFNGVIENMRYVSRDQEQDPGRPTHRMILNDTRYPSEADAFEVRYFRHFIIVSVFWSNDCMKRLIQLADTTVPARLISDIEFERMNDETFTDQNLKDFFNGMSESEQEYKQKFVPLVCKIARIVELFHIDVQWGMYGNTLFNGKMRKRKVKMTPQKENDSDDAQMADYDEENFLHLLQPPRGQQTLEGQQTLGGQQTLEGQQTLGATRTDRRADNRNIASIGGAMDILSTILGTPLNVARGGARLLGTLGPYIRTPRPPLNFDETVANDLQNGDLQVPDPNIPHESEPY